MVASAQLVLRIGDRVFSVVLPDSAVDSIFRDRGGELRLDLPSSVRLVALRSLDEVVVDTMVALTYVPKPTDDDDDGDGGDDTVGVLDECED